MNRKLQVVDYILLGISVISVIGLIFYFANIFFSTPGEVGTKEYDPFYTYYTNRGIVAIFTTRFILWTTTLTIGTVWILNKEIGARSGITILILISLIAVLEWIELWYGSTFYYGEVRDKQGVGFPVLSILLMTYILLKLKISNSYLRIGLVVVTIAIHYLVFNLVHEEWRLFYEIYIPGTSIPMR